MKMLLKEYRVEIIVIILAIISLVLLVGDFGVKGAVRSGFYGSLSEAQNIFQSILERLINYLLNLSALDIIGWAIIFGTILFVSARIRYRYRSKSEFVATVCPRCSSPIKRVHRSSFDRFLGATIMPNARRYMCINRRCGWSGLRRQHFRSESNPSESEAPLRS